MRDVIVSDTSVLINFLKIDRLDLLGNCSLHFLVTDHVRHDASLKEGIKRLLSFSSSTVSLLWMGYLFWKTIFEFPCFEHERKMKFSQIFSISFQKGG